MKRSSLERFTCVCVDRINSRLILHLLQTIVRIAQTALSYILMLMVMNNFAGFFLSAIIGKYLAKIIEKMFCYLFLYSPWYWLLSVKWCSSIHT